MAHDTIEGCSIPGRLKCFQGFSFALSKAALGLLCCCCFPSSTFCDESGLSFADMEWDLHHSETHVAYDGCYVLFSLPKSVVHISDVKARKGLVYVRHE